MYTIPGSNTRRVIFTAILYQILGNQLPLSYSCFTSNIIFSLKVDIVV